MMRNVTDYNRKKDKTWINATAEHTSSAHNRELKQTEVNGLYLE